MKLMENNKNRKKNTQQGLIVFYEQGKRETFN